MCLAATTGFGSSPSAASDARHWISDHLHRWDIDEVRDTALLLSSELVTNAVLHASSATEVSMAVVDGALEVSVSDSEPQVAIAAAASPPRPGQQVRTSRSCARAGAASSWSPRSPTRGAPASPTTASGCGSGSTWESRHTPGDAVVASRSMAVTEARSHRSTRRGPGGPGHHALPAVTACLTVLAALAVVTTGPASARSASAGAPPSAVTGGVHRRCRGGRRDATRRRARRGEPGRGRAPRPCSSHSTTGTTCCRSRSPTPTSTTTASGTWASRSSTARRRW